MTPRVVLALVAAGMVLTAAVLLDHRRDLRAEIAGLGRTGAELRESAANAQRTEQVDRVRLQLERARATSPRTAQPHLALAVGDSMLTLERGGVVLRMMSVSSDVTRGVRLVERVEEERVLLGGGLILRAWRGGESASSPARGTIQVSRADFEAIRPNLSRGTMAFVF